MATVQIGDTTLRDGPQCLWATRMPTSMMLPIASKLDAVGFSAIELMGVVHFDACVRYLREDPWARIREIKSRVSRTPLQAFIRSRCVLSFDPQPWDLNFLFVERLIANGIDRIVGFDGLHDIDNLAPALLRAKELGAHTTGWLIFSGSPIHTDELYAAKAREFIKKANVDELQIQDTSGILTPERTATLVRAVRSAIGDRPLELHSHSAIGLPQRSYLEAAAQGVRTLYACLPPVADGNAPPNFVTLVKNLKYEGHDVDVDMHAAEEVIGYLTTAAELAGFPAGVPQDFDAAQYDHQIPGGVMSNLVAQLEQLGLSNRLPDVLKECGRVRQELGWPIMVTPFSQLVAVQATLNVVNEKRYSVIPNEVRKYVEGHYGKPLAPIDEYVRGRVAEIDGGAQKPGDPDGVVESLRDRFPKESDEERLLRYAFPPSLVDQMGRPWETEGPPGIAQAPLAVLVKNLIARKDLDRVFVRGGNVEISYTQHARIDGVRT